LADPVLLRIRLTLFGIRTHTMSEDPIAPISKTLAKPMEDLFRAGGFALAFGYAGLVIMVIAVYTAGQLQVPLFVIGALLTFLCLAFFLFTSLRTRSVARSVSEDLPLLDALQRAAYQAAELASVTQSFAFKHLEKIQNAISVVVPMVESLPVVGPAAKRAGLTNAATLSTAIVSATEGTKTTVLQFQEAIRQGNLREIKKYGKQLEEAVANLKTALRESADP
jgi:hypothetical protein